MQETGDSLRNKEISGGRGALTLPLFVSFGELWQDFLGFCRSAKDSIYLYYLQTSREGCLVFKLVDRLGSGLGKATLRHNVLSNNLANSNTPGFKRSDVVETGFSRELARRQGPRLSRTHQRHLPGAGRTGRTSSASYAVVQDNSTSMRNDGNNVDPDREQVLLLENQLYYESLTDAVSRKLGQLRTVIGEGRR
jgi:flagellar basal-body rod protein FlgB